MILHIGDNNYILKDDIIAILDRKSADGTKGTREFINSLINNNCLVGELDPSIKSYILVNNDKKTIIHTSNISSKTLANRSSCNR